MLAGGVNKTNGFGPSWWFLPVLSSANLLSVLCLSHMSNPRAPVGNRVTSGPELARGWTDACEWQWPLCFLPLSLCEMTELERQDSDFCRKAKKKSEFCVRSPNVRMLAISFFRYWNIVSHIKASYRLWCTILPYYCLASKVYLSLLDGPSF